MAAEAALMKNDQTLAKYYFNKTWERAGNDKFTGVLTMKDIMDEQARELSFEGDRWYFLKRLGILIEQITAYAGDPEIPASILGRNNLPANPHFVRWPIPEAEVINMGAENFPQNIGYIYTHHCNNIHIIKMRKKITILTLLFCSFVTGLFANTPQYDICIYGESASGVIAAIQGARMGKKVVLISKNDHVGGLVTTGLTATDINRNDLIGGITKEFYNKIYNYYLQPEVWHNQDRESFMVSTLKRTYRGKNDERQIQWVYESSVAERIMRDMLKTAGVEILFNHRLDLNKNVRKEENIIRSIQLENGKVIEAKMFIDASYEGDLLARAGVSYTVGRESNLQYGETYNGIRLNYKQGKDLTKISPYIKEGNVKSGALPYVTDREWGKQGDADKREQA